MFNDNLGLYLNAPFHKKKYRVTTVSRREAPVRACERINKIIRQ